MPVHFGPHSRQPRTLSASACAFSVLGLRLPECFLRPRHGTSQCGPLCFHLLPSPRVGDRADRLTRGNAHLVRKVLRQDRFASPLACVIPRFADGQPGRRLGQEAVADELRHALLGAPADASRTRADSRCSSRNRSSAAWVGDPCVTMRRTRASWSSICRRSLPSLSSNIMLDNGNGPARFRNRFTPLCRGHPPRGGMAHVAR
jgi:hypothetical protein